MFNLLMVINNIQNSYGIAENYPPKHLKSEGVSTSANTMPNNNHIINEAGVTKKPLNNTPPNFIRHVYINNQSSSNGSLTESFIRSRASLSPSYFHNEITTRYNMISKIPVVLNQIKKSVDKIA